jgi:hypothetical protein
MTLSHHGHTAKKTKTKNSRGQTNMLEIGQISCFGGSFFFQNMMSPGLLRIEIFECFHTGTPNRIYLVHHCYPSVGGKLTV